MKHMISKCFLALDRYTWRHNEVLKIMFDLTLKQVNEINDGKRPQTTKDKRSIKFFLPGKKNIIRSTKKTVDDERWSGHWEAAADIPGKQSPFVIPSSKKQDIVV